MKNDDFDGGDEYFYATPFYDDRGAGTEYAAAAADVKTGELSYSCGDILSDNAKAPYFLINDILETDSHGLLAGASMAFKTFADIRLAYSVCTGLDFFGHTVFNTGKVLYICGEGKGALSRRLLAIKMHMGSFNGNLLVLDEHICIDQAGDMGLLRTLIEDVKPILIIFDTFASLISVTDENKTSEVGRVLRAVKETCRFNGACSLIIHHYGKDQKSGMRGASNFFNDSDFAIEMSRVQDTMLTTFSCKKMKDGDYFEDIIMKAHVVDLGLIRQDGEMAKSIILLPTNDVPDNKKSILSIREENCLHVIAKVIRECGVPVPESVVVMFPDSPHLCPKTGGTVEIFRVPIYEILSVTNDSKRKIFARVFKTLEEKRKILINKDFVCVIDE